MTSEHRPISRGSLLLALIALCAATLIALTYQFTGETIARQKRLADEQALLEIIPRHRHDNSMLDDTLIAGPEDTALGLREQSTIYIARQQGQVVAVILPVIAPDGYAGDIALRVGVNRDGSVAAVRVLSHEETPGLGDRIELDHSNWILGFDGRSLANTDVDDWAVERDNGVFDQFTGATITPRAVVAAVSRALQFAEANRARLFGAAEPAHSGSE